jgi:hypothetical protein
MDRDPIGRAVRDAARQRRLGADAACMYCGVREIEALVRTGSRLIQADHLVNRANDAHLTGPACRNCHAIVTARRLDAGVSERPPASGRAAQYERLKALAVLHRTLADAFDRWAEDLTPNTEES